MCFVSAAKTHQKYEYYLIFRDIRLVVVSSSKYEISRLKRETLSKLSTYKIQEEKKSVSKNTVLSILELSIDYQ